MLLVETTLMRAVSDRSSVQLFMRFHGRCGLEFFILRRLISDFCEHPYYVNMKILLRGEHIIQEDGCTCFPQGFDKYRVGFL